MKLREKLEVGSCKVKKDGLCNVDVFNAQHTLACCPLCTHLAQLATEYTIRKKSFSLLLFSLFRATSHTRLKVHDHCNLRALIGHKGGDRPSSLHTQRWRSKSPKKTLWMKSLHGVLHGGLWIRFHVLLEFSSGLPPRGGMTQKSGDHELFNVFSDKFQGIFQNKFHNRFLNIFQDSQILSNW